MNATSGGGGSALYRRWHTTLLVIATLLSLLSVIGAAFWIHALSTFQLGLLGFLHVLTGLLIGVHISASVLSDSRPETTPLLRRHLREYQVFRNGSAVVIVIALVGILISGAYFYELGLVLVKTCPAEHHSALLSHNRTSVHLFLVHSDRYNARYDTRLHTPYAQQFCASNLPVESDYSLLEHEIGRLVQMNHSGGKRVHVSDMHEEDGLFRLVLARNKCLSEQAFSVGIILFLLIWDLLALNLLAYSLWLLLAGDFRSAASPNSIIGTHRRYHFIFLALYALFTCLFVVGCAVWLTYKSTFQAGLLGLLHVLTGVLIGLYITGEVVILPRAGASPEQHRRSNEYAVFRRASTATIVIAVIGVIFTAFYLYNLFYIIVGICPDQHHHHAIASALVLIHYEHRPRDAQYLKSDILFIQYNTTGRHLILPRGGDVYHRYHRKTVYPPESHDLDGFCLRGSGGSNGAYPLLESEIEHLFYSVAEQRREAKSVQFLERKEHHGHHGNEEDSIFLELMVRYICRNEQYLVILIIVYVLVWDVFALIVAGYNIWLLRRNKDLYA